MDDGPLKETLMKLKSQLEKLLQDLQDLESERKRNTQDQGKYIYTFILFNQIDFFPNWLHV